VKNSIYRFVSRSLCIVILILIFSSQAVFAADSARSETYLDSVMELIQEQYYGEISDDKLVDNAIRGMLNSLDDYTTYYDNEEKDVFMDSITGIFGGIGVTMEMSGDYIIISKVFTESPAEKAGLQQGDKIVEAAGVDLVRATSEKAASIIKGEPGTTVKLGILRNGSNDKIYINVVREIIKVNPVTYENRNGIGYIRLDMFNENTSEYINQALAEFDNRKINNIVLDLRTIRGARSARLLR
jgi:carboxyl-terminal processing protease